MSVPTATIRGEETTDGTTVTDLSFDGGEIGATEAYLVVPAGGATGAAGATGATGPAILWFHWLEGGSPTSNRTEFLDEARSFARRGVTSLLVQGVLPWLERPSGIDHDRTLIQQEVAMLRRAVELLLAQPGVDPTRLAAVGHDFGAMYESLLFGEDQRIGSFVLMAPTARWADWFTVYWRLEDETDAYVAALAPLDPVAHLPRAEGRPILLQFAARDDYVPAEVAAEITAAAGPSAEARTYDCGHEMDAVSRADREGWLTHRLGLGQET